MSVDNVVVARNTENAPQSSLHSQTTAFSHYNNLSAQLPIDPKTNELVGGTAGEQAEQCFKNIDAIVDSIGHDLTDIVRISIFVTDIRDTVAVDKVMRAYFPTYVPSRTVVAVADLPMGALVQVEALLSNGEGTIPDAPQAGDLIKLTNNTPNAPIDAMQTQTVAFSHYNNISAQLPIDPATGRLVPGGIEDQTRQCLKNIKAILLGIDVPFDDIVKTTIFVKNLEDMDAVNRVYTTFFPDSGIARAHAYVPARTVVPVDDLPMGALVQVEAVVSHGDGTPPQEVEARHGLIVEANNTAAAPLSELSTQSVAFSHYNNISGQFAVDAATGKFVGGSVAEQTTLCLQHIKTIIESVEHTIDEVVKVNVYLRDIQDMDALDEAYAAFFPQGTPARRVVACGRLPLDALVQIEAIVANAEGTPPVK